MTRQFTIYITFLFLLLAQTSIAQTIEIPFGSAPTFDGVLD